MNTMDVCCKPKVVPILWIGSFGSEKINSLASNSKHEDKKTNVFDSYRARFMNILLV